MKNHEEEEVGEVLTPDFGPRSLSEFSSEESSSSMYPMIDERDSYEIHKKKHHHCYDFTSEFVRNTKQDDSFDHKTQNSLQEAWNHTFSESHDDSWFDSSFKKSVSVSIEVPLNEKTEEDSSKVIRSENKNNDKTIDKNVKEVINKNISRTSRKLASRSMSRIEAKSRNFLETLQTARKALLPQGSYFFHSKRETSSEMGDAETKPIKKNLESEKSEKKPSVSSKEKTFGVLNSDDDSDDEKVNLDANDLLTLSTVSTTPQSSPTETTSVTNVHNTTEKPGDSSEAFVNMAETANSITSSSSLNNNHKHYSEPNAIKDSNKEILTDETKLVLKKKDVFNDNIPPTNINTRTNTNSVNSTKSEKNTSCSPPQSPFLSSNKAPSIADISNEILSEGPPLEQTDDENTFDKMASIETTDLEPLSDNVAQTQALINAPFPKPCFDQSTFPKSNLILLRKSSDPSEIHKATDLGSFAAAAEENTSFKPRSTSNFRSLKDTTLTSPVYRLPEAAAYQQQSTGVTSSRESFVSYKASDDQKKQQLLYMKKSDSPPVDIEETASTKFMRSNLEFETTNLPVVNLDSIICTLPERVLFNDVVYTPVELKMLQALRNFVSDAPDEVLLRLLWYHQQEPLSQAVSHWSFLQDWMQTEHPKASEVYQRYCSTGCVYAYGSSLWGHPVIVCRVAEFLKIGLNFHILMAVHVINVIRSQILDPGKVEQIVILVDMTNCSLLEASLILFVRGLNRLFCGVIAAWIFTNCDIATYVSIVDFEEYETPLRAKFFYVTPKTIGQFICVNQLEQRYGGLAGNAERFDVFYSVSCYGAFSQVQKYYLINPVGATLPMQGELPALSQNFADKGQISSKDLPRAHALIKHITQTLEKQKCLESFLFRILVHRAIFSLSPQQSNSLLLPFEQVMVAKAQALLTEMMMSSEDKQYASYIRKIHSGELQWLILRCLYSTKGDFFATSYLVLLYLRFRKKKRNAKIWNAAKALYCTNQHTLWGHPIIVFHVQRCLSFYFKRNVEDRSQALDVVCGGVSSQLERVKQELVYGHIEQWFLLLNLENTVIEPFSESLECLNHVLEYIENMYPMYTAFLVLRKASNDYAPPKRFESVTIRLTSDSDLSFWTSANLDSHFSTAGNTGGTSCNTLLSNENNRSAQSKTLLPIEPVWYSIPLPYRRSPLNFLEHIAKHLDEYSFAQKKPASLSFKQLVSSQTSAPPPLLLPLATQLLEARLASTPYGGSFAAPITRSNPTEALLVTTRSSRNQLERNARNNNELEFPLSGSNDSMVKLMTSVPRNSCQAQLKSNDAGVLLLKTVPLTTAPQTLTPHGIPIQPQSGIAVSLPNAIVTTRPNTLPKDLTRQVRGNHELRSNFEQVWYTNLQSKFEKQGSYDQHTASQSFADLQRYKSKNLSDLPFRHEVIKSSNQTMKLDLGTSTKIKVGSPQGKETLCSSASPVMTTIPPSEPALKRKKKVASENKLQILMKRLVVSTGNNDNIQEFLVEPFLKKAQGDMTKTAQAYLEHLNWKKKRLLSIEESELANKLKAPKLCYVFGHDRESNPILVSRLSCLQQFDLPVAENYVLYTLDKLIQELAIKQQDKKEASPNKITVIVDVDGFSVSGLLSVGSKAFIKVILGNYPERLNKMFILNATSTFKMFWSVTIRTQLSQNTRNKIIVLDNNYLEVLLKTISKSQLEISLGGKQPEAHFPPFQIPPLNVPASRFP